MAHRFALLLISLLIAGFGAVGCGGDDEEDSGSSGGTTTEESATEESTTKDTPSTDDPALSGAQRKQAEESCKQSITAQSQLSADVKADLEEICEEAAKGDEDAVRKATKEVCVKIVEDTAPAGPARDQALTACDQATTP
jgi:flagellar motor protein MotB